MSHPTEALARVLPLPGCNCEAHYSEGGLRLCKAWRERDRLRQARDILADPGPLLEALAEAGVLVAHGEALIHYRYGVNTGTLRAADDAASIVAAVQRHERATHGPVAVDRIDVRTRYTRVTEWRPSDG